MDDNKILDLYWERSEVAIIETANKYSRYCHYISYNILHNDKDAEECVNDTYLNAWNSIPPQRPTRLSTYLGKITRNISLNRYKHFTAEKRGCGQTELALSELENCIPVTQCVEQATDEVILVESINQFLYALPKIKRTVFVRRYWYLSSIRDIAEQDYTLNVKVDTLKVDEVETERVVGMYSGSQLAKERGWTDKYLAEHFVVVRAIYYVEYDHTKTFLDDGYVGQYFYLTRNEKTGLWTIIDNTGTYDID